MARNRDNDIIFAIIWGIICFVVCLGEAGGGRVLRFWIFVSLIWSGFWFYTPFENQVGIIGLIVWWILYWVIDPD